MKNMKAVDLVNCFTPFHLNEQPILMQMPNISQYFVSVYSTVDKLKESMERCGITDYKIKFITGTVDFIKSLHEENIRLMLDPCITDKNTTKWTEVLNYEIN